MCLIIAYFALDAYYNNFVFLYIFLRQMKQELHCQKTYKATGSQKRRAGTLVASGGPQILKKSEHPKHDQLSWHWTHFETQPTVEMEIVVAPHSIKISKDIIMSGLPLWVSERFFPSNSRGIALWTFGLRGFILRSTTLDGMLVRSYHNKSMPD